ncbi:MAG TPA: hypothetical protein VKY92_06720 [Verrucomicrobiae bacterium]|nr:hypothetical protein [Verrucomicrobiae bacterium]
MKQIRGSVLVFVGVVVLLTALVILVHHKKNRPLDYFEDDQPAGQVINNTNIALPPASAPQGTAPAIPHSITKRSSEFTPGEREKLAADFEQKYKPAVHRWFEAFQGRVPFDESDFTLDKFHSRLGDYMYTFMIGTTTFTVQDSPHGGVKVSYLMTRDGAVQLNSLPGGASAPTLTMPVTREDVISMAKADCGREFKPNEVIIRPSAAGTSLDGGALVHIVPEGTDPNNLATQPLNMVFGKDGKLVNYTRDPFL